MFNVFNDGMIGIIFEYDFEGWFVISLMDSEFIDVIFVFEYSGNSYF